jgi:hypothetical protein
MELYVIVPIISFVGGWLGSFLGAYLKKKGENLATHEDISELVEQVSAVTKATKEIEARISDEVWDRQRLWEMKRDAFFVLMKAESAAANALFGFMSACDVAKDHPPENQAALNLRRKSTAEWLAAGAEFDSARAQVSLVCGQEVDKRLVSLDTLFKKTAVGLSKGEDVSGLDKQFLRERHALRAAVRAELTEPRRATNPPPSHN